ncbi:MAG: very short patch repair endonuclease [Methylobacter sp.]
MADTLTPEQRRRCMSNVRNKNTGLEMKLRRALWKTGLRYRVNSKLPGKPDIVFPKRKLAVFVDGCFWHGCPIHGTKPETNAEFWQTKIKVNMVRDLRVTSQLTDLGWTVIRVWEHEIKECLAVVIQNITESLNSV